MQPNALLNIVRRWPELSLGIALLTAAQAYGLGADFVPLCTSDENCAVGESTLVAFGAGERQVYRTLRGDFICNSARFGLASAPPESICSALEVEPNSDSYTAEALLNNVPVGAQVAVISRATGKALTRQTAHKNLVVQQDFTGSDDQLWQLHTVAGGYYALLDPEAQRALDVSNWSNSDGAPLKQTSWMDSWSQHWSIDPTQGPFVRISSRTTGKSVDVYEMNQKENGPICSWTFWGGDNQQWYLLPWANEDQSVQVMAAQGAR